MLTFNGSLLLVITKDPQNGNLKAPEKICVSFILGGDPKFALERCSPGPCWCQDDAQCPGSEQVAE